MTILTFAASEVAAQIAHAQSCSKFLPNWNGPVGSPALILIVGHGVQLISNGIDNSTTRIVAGATSARSAPFAAGLNPFTDPDWATERQSVFRDLAGQFYTDILDDAQALIDRGRDQLRLATDGHTVRVFANQTSDYLLGGTYKVPSGLGGVFHVTLKDISETYALVQNTGNCEDFDDMKPYRVPLDDLKEIETRRAA